MEQIANNCLLKFTPCERLFLDLLCSKGARALTALSHLFRVLRAHDVPKDVLRQREVKWLDMLGHWDKWMIKRFNKVS